MSGLPSNVTDGMTRHYNPATATECWTGPATASEIARMRNQIRTFQAGSPPTRVTVHAVQAPASISSASCTPSSASATSCIAPQAVGFSSPVAQVETTTVSTSRTASTATPTSSTATGTTTTTDAQGGGEGSTPGGSTDDSGSDEEPPTPPAEGPADSDAWYKVRVRELAAEYPHVVPGSALERLKRNWESVRSRGKKLDPPEKKIPLECESRGADGHRAERGAHPNYSASPDRASIVKPATDAFSFDRKSAETVINYLIRSGLQARLSAYPTAGRGPILNNLTPTPDNLDVISQANAAGSAIGVNVHRVINPKILEGDPVRAVDLEPLALLLDMDGPQADGKPWTADAIRDHAPSGLPLLLIIETSPGRYHVIFGPVVGLDLEAFRVTGKALAAMFPGADPVTSPRKTIRLAGCINWKNQDHPHVVRASKGTRES